MEDISLLLNQGGNHLTTVDKTAVKQNRALYSNLTRMMTQGYVLLRVLKDQNGEPVDFYYVDINPAFEKMFGMARDQVIGKTHLQILAYAEVRWLEVFDRVARTAQTVRIEQFSSGFRRYLRVTAYAPAPGLVVGLFDDLTEHKQLETALKNSEERHRQLFEQAPDGIFVADLRGRYVDVNQAGCELLGRKREEIIGKSIVDLIPPEDVLRLYGVKEDLLRGGTQTGEWRMLHKAGHYLDVEISARILPEGTWQGFVREIGERKQAERQLKQAEVKLTHLAHHDILTGLANRLVFNAHLEQALERAKRHHHKMALLFIDLDRFKRVNDRLGHDAGDKLLKIIADRLHNSVRGEDMVARIGGDEFTIILEQIANAGDAALLAQKLIKVIVNPVPIGDRKVVTSTSIGISIYPDDADNATDLLKAADAAMYRAKGQGRRNFEFFAPEPVS